MPACESVEGAYTKVGKTGVETFEQGTSPFIVKSTHVDRASPLAALAVEREHKLRLRE